MRNRAVAAVLLACRIRARRLLFPTSADAQASDCRSDMTTVLLGVATLPAKMTADNAS